MHNLHWNLLLPMILRLQLRVVNRDVLLNVLPRQRDLFVLPRPIHTHQRPVRDRDWHAQDEHKEQIRLEATPVNEGEHTLDEPWDSEDEGGEVDVVEGAVALRKRDKRRVFVDGSIGETFRCGRHGRRRGR